jgi:hypothetical protein
MKSLLVVVMLLLAAIFSEQLWAHRVAERRRRAEIARIGAVRDCKAAESWASLEQTIKELNDKRLSATDQHRTTLSALKVCKQAVIAWESAYPDLLAEHRVTGDAPVVPNLPD